jgi:hypothetical protein
MRKRLIGFIFCLFLVSCCLVIFTLGCGQQSSETTTTTTTTIPPSAEGAKASSEIRGSYVVCSGTRTVEGSSIRAQGTAIITGTVYDLITSQPVQGVKVWAGADSSATTDSNGKYTLTGVGTGDVAVTVLSPTTYSDYYKKDMPVYLNLTVVSQAANIDFYLCRILTADMTSGSIKANFYDSGGSNPLSITDESIYLTTYDGYGSSIITTHACVPPTPEVSYYTVSAINSTNAAANFTKNNYGAGYKAGLTVNTNQTTEANIPIYRVGVDPTFSISGTATVPTGLSLTIDAISLVYLVSNYCPGFLMHGSRAVNGNSYSVAGFPPSDASSFALYLGAFNSDWTKCSYAYDKDLTTAAESSSIKNYTLLDPPEDLSVTQQTVNGTHVLNISWTPATTWTPDYYLIRVWMSPYLIFVISKGTSVQIPVQENGSTWGASVNAFKTPSKVDINNINLLNLTFTRMSNLGKSGTF